MDRTHRFQACSFPRNTPRLVSLRLAVAIAVVASCGGCGSDAPSNAYVPSPSSSSGGAGTGSSSGSVYPSSSSSSSSGGAQSSPSEDAAGDDAPATFVPDGGDAQSSCVRGQVPPSKVIVLGDSYLDHPFWSNAIPFLYANLRSAGSLGATATYREYQLGGASMNYGSANLNIPYQYETSAKMDVSVSNPTDIDTVIMDGGGNDVIIDNRNCLTDAQPPPADTTCATAIQATVNRAGMLFQEMAGDGIKHLVFLFYPHLDPAGGGLLPMPAPQVNATLDYAYTLAEQVCCGSTFTSTSTSYTCGGSINGMQCVFIDARPAFEGHTADYIKSDFVHPTDAGAQVLADLMSQTMTSYCIAQ